eukprot:COSAG04_NODE_1528_length_6453_cov_6.160529_11_plen_107_part_00
MDKAREDLIKELLEAQGAAMAVEEPEGEEAAEAEEEVANWKVEKVVGRRETEDEGRAVLVEYKLRWLGYTQQHDTWHTQRDIEDWLGDSGVTGRAAVKAHVEGRRA